MNDIKKCLYCDKDMKRNGLEHYKWDKKKFCSLRCRHAFNNAIYSAEYHRNTAKMVKTCATCGETKQIYNFQIKRDKEDGRASDCKVCTKAKKKSRQDENNDYLKLMHITTLLRKPIVKSYENVILKYSPLSNSLRVFSDV